MGNGSIVLTRLRVFKLDGIICHDVNYLVLARKRGSLEHCYVHTVVFTVRAVLGIRCVTIFARQRTIAKPVYGFYGVFYAVSTGFNSGDPV